MEKNQRLANYLETLGFENQASVIRTDSSIRQVTSFNVLKTWTEYINRVIGAIIGILILLTLVSSVKLIKSDSALFIWSAVLFLLVILQGWIGSVVVSTHLTTWMVTIHMIIAVVIIAVLTYLVFRSRKYEFVIRYNSRPELLNILLIVSSLLIVIQIIMGTQVREVIDTVASALNYRQRDTWIQSAGVEFYIHRSFSLVLLAFQIGILLTLYRNRTAFIGAFNYSKVLLILILMEIGFGVVMAYFGIPPFIQPAHLLTGVLIFGLRFFLLLMVNNVQHFNRKREVIV
jgi:cytochrome c oxidase assembly protein subunit 15